jgi:hypothetical protein
MTEEIHTCNLHCDRPNCIKQQRDDLRQKYFELCDIQAKSLHHAQVSAKAEADAAVMIFRLRLADAIEALPFGDTAASFAVFVRDFE